MILKKEIKNFYDDIVSERLNEKLGKGTINTDPLPLGPLFKMVMDAVKIIDGKPDYTGLNDGDIKYLKHSGIMRSIERYCGIDVN